MTMKRILYILTFAVASILASCTPSDYEVFDMGTVDMNDVEKIKLRISHYQLLADGKAQLEFNPLLTTKDSIDVLDSRVDHSQIEYHTTSGEILPKIFKTDDRSLIGKEIKVYAKIKGTNLLSDTLSFTVTDPSAAEQFTEIVVPVVFHIIQSNTEILEYGGELPAERIYLFLEKINNTFSGKVSTAATGVDTKIRFQVALYDPYGNKLIEPGINRIYMEEVTDKGEDQYRTLIEEQEALWPYDKYLNIWLISDRENEYSYFFRDITQYNQPRYVSSESDLAQAPQGLEFSLFPTDYTPVPAEVGILYKFQSLLKKTRECLESEENELVNALGLYLGLLPTYTNLCENDYCDDTQVYSFHNGAGGSYNLNVYKLEGNYYFLAENIMDDAGGGHRSVTLQQAQRARWVLEHCPERSCWKSTWALTGK